METSLYNLDCILQFSLLTAGEEDDWKEQNLSRIHLIKYAYLADLIYSESNNGDSFTGIDWQFYKFGPWSNVVNSQIDQSMSAIRAERKTFESDYSDEDRVSWCKRDSKKLRDLQDKLPIVVTGRLKKYVHKYTNDTASLLHFVYSTEPMLRTKPHDKILFVSKKKVQVKSDAKEFIDFDSLSIKNKKKFLIKKEEYQLKKDLILQKKRNAKQKSTHPIEMEPELLQKGTRWLDELAGPKIIEGNHSLKFDDSVWQSISRTRKNELS